MATEPTEAPLPSSKPAFLRRVQIRNYKSIAFCDVTLEPLTILVGRNATGKSNFLDALGFLRDVVVKGVREAVQLHGGRDAVLNRSAETPRVTIDIETFHAGDGESGSMNAKFTIAIDFAHDTSPKIVQDDLNFYSSNGSLLIGYHMEGIGVHWKGGEVSQFMAGWSRGEQIFLSFARGMIGYSALYDAILTFTAYNLSPIEMRSPKLRTPGTFLYSDGSNLASVYNATKATDRAAADRAVRYLNAIAHSVEFVHVVLAGSHEVMEFDTSGNVDDWDGPLRKADRFPAESMSDGTLRAFAAVMAAFQTIAPYGSPSLVAIEEPETALHPAAMRALVAALDEATLRTQILITTHSPDLLDAEEVKPANVRIVQLVDGHTIIGPVDEASVEIVKKELNTLSGLERGDQLFPDLDDQDRQQLLARNESGVPI